MLKYAYTKSRAIAHLTTFNDSGTRWTAKLSVGKGVGHTSINVYANREYAGTLMGDMLGAALYQGKNDSGVEGRAISLTWEKVLRGVEEVYSHRTAWGTWFCHDITAAVFRSWGLRGQKVYEAAYGSTPYGRTGLVIARIAALSIVPFMTLAMDSHREWNKFQELWRHTSDHMRFPNYLNMTR